MSKGFKRRSEKLNIARNLPPSYHKFSDEPYNVKKSEVVNWLIQRPSILEYIWDKIKQSNDVFYNSETGKWQGVDYEEDAE